VKQLNFGVGRHFCLGAALARMELRTIFATMLDQWSEFAVEADAAIDRTGGSASVGSLRFTCTSRVSLP
jgi:cytochrome P450